MAKLQLARFGPSERAVSASGQIDWRDGGCGRGGGEGGH